MNRLRVIAILGALMVAGDAAATDVTAAVASQEVYVGVPFTFRISIADAATSEEPQFPDMPGLSRVAGPMRQDSSSTVIVSGRVTRRSMKLFTYQLVAELPGEVTIPSITVIAEGKRYRTLPILLTALKSEVGDKLFVDVKADRDVFYLGETIDVDLDIWILPFIEPYTNQALDYQDMFNAIDTSRSTWGVFARGLNEIKPRKDARADADGNEQIYYVYRIHGRVIPQQAGFLTFDEIRIVTAYPKEIRRTRRIFNRGQWEITRSQPMVGTPAVAPIRIEPAPAEGRPSSFAGAVGRFHFDVIATPRDVAVGDPITLTMTITDRSGDTLLDVIRPPPLESVDELTRKFRIATDPPGGTVRGNRKTFTQTVRARNDEVQRIPAIPFSYFDPEAERYVTVHSDPIDIEVREAAMLSEAEIIDASGARRHNVTELTEVEGGILANYTGAESLLSSNEFSFGWIHASVVLVPPAVFVFAIAGIGTRDRRSDQRRLRRRKARSKAIKRLRAGDGPQVTADVLGDYVADRCNLPPGALTGAEVVARLKVSEAPEALVSEIETLLTTCEAMRYAGEDAGDADSITQRAARCIERLERERI